MTTDTDTAPDTATDTDIELADELFTESYALLPTARAAYDGDGDLVGLVYFAHETRRWYAVDLDGMSALVREGRRPDWYSLWCSGSTPAGEGNTAEWAASAAGWEL